MDGFLKDPANDIFSIGYYQESDIPFYAALARNFTTCDHYFASVLGPTFPNRMFLYAGQTDRTDDSVSISLLPTIMDKLAAAGVSHTYYYSNIPYLTLWASQYLNISKLYSQFLTDAANGTLPAVSFVDPFYTVLDDGTGNDDHPHGDIRKGEVFLHEVFQAVANGPGWASTVLVFNFDEWGGFFDHVPPPLAPLPPATRAAGDADGRLGFRVPCLLIAPWARRGHVAHTPFDHTSFLRLVAWRWGLEPLTIRDETARNLAEALDFAHPDLAAPPADVPAGPFGAPCPAAPPKALAELHAIARRVGWPLHA
jgi:phospholipase C